MYRPGGGGFRRVEREGVGEAEEVEEPNSDVREPQTEEVVFGSRTSWVLEEGSDGVETSAPPPPLLGFLFLTSPRTLSSISATLI